PPLPMHSQPEPYQASGKAGLSHAASSLHGISQLSRVNSQISHHGVTTAAALRRDLQRRDDVTRPLLGQRHDEGARLTREGERASLAAEQCDARDLARVMRAALSEALDRQLPVAWPAERERVERLAPGGEADVFGRIGTRRVLVEVAGPLDVRRTFAEERERPRAVDGFT